MLSDCQPTPVTPCLRPPATVAACAGADEVLLDCLLDVSDAQVLVAL